MARQKALVAVVRTEDIGNKLTGNMGYTLTWAHTLRRRVNGTETTICEFGQKRGIHRKGALSGILIVPQPAFRLNFSDEIALN